MSTLDKQMKHTPGPWEAESDECAKLRDQRGGLIATFSFITLTGKRDTGEVFANLRLAAAAPALADSEEANLRVLENLHTYLTKHADKLPPFSLASLEVRIDATRAALKLAEGS